MMRYGLPRYRAPGHLLWLTREVLVFREAARVSGQVTMGRGCSVWYNAVIRGDEAPISVGENTNIQDCAVLHTTEGYPLTVGSGVTVGHSAILHSCAVGDNTLIGMGAIVLDEAVVGRDCRGPSPPTGPWPPEARPRWYAP